MLHQLTRRNLPSIFLPFLCVIAVSFFFHVPSHLHVSISSSHHVSFSLSQPFSLWHQCKASIIEWCMGVCVSGIEGLGTPPAPPAEEALTAEHGGSSLPPSSHAQFHISADLPPPLTPSPSFVFSLAFYLFPVVRHILAQSLDAHYIRSYFHIYVCPQLCFLSPISLCPLLFTPDSDWNLFIIILVIILCGAGAGQSQCLLTATAKSVCFLLFTSEVRPLRTFLFMPAGRTVHTSHATFKKV